MRIRRLHSNRHLRSGRESRRDFKLERSRWVAVLQHPNWSLAKVWAESSPDRAPPNGDVGRQRKPSSDLMRDRIASPPSRSNEPGLQGPRPASGDFWVLAGRHNLLFCHGRESQICRTRMLGEPPQRAAGKISRLTVQMGGSPIFLANRRVTAIAPPAARQGAAEK